MARSNKAQHKIPATYLDSFTDTNSNLWVADDKFNIYPQKPGKTLRESDYYTIRFKTGGGTLNVETKFFGGIETKYSLIYKEKLSKRLPITVEEKANLAIFVASMLERQPAMRASLEKFFSDIKEQIEHLRSLPDEVKEQMAKVPIFRSDSEPSMSADEILEAGEDIGSLHSSLIPDTVADIAPIIFRMKWLFIIRPSDAYPYITSDHPCTMVDPVAEKKYGKGTMGSIAGFAYADTELTLPLSPDLALMCRWEATEDCVYGTLPAEMVREINGRSMRGAKVIIGSDEKMIRKLVTNVKMKQSIMEKLFD